jgi:hypothetical protein
MHGDRKGRKQPTKVGGKGRFAQSVSATPSQCHALSEENSREGRGGRHLEGDELPFSPLERWALLRQCHAFSRTALNSVKTISLAVHVPQFLILFKEPSNEESARRGRFAQ